MHTNDMHTDTVPKRLYNRFFAFAIDDAYYDQWHSIYDSMTEQVSHDWPSALQKYKKNVLEGLMDIYTRVEAQLKPTPMKVQYTFNWRDVCKLLMSI
jgi:hypothetical protein